MIVFAASGVVAALGVGVLLLMAAVLYGFPVVGPILAYLYKNDWAIPMVIVSVLVLFVILFFIMTAGTLRYLSDISTTVNRIATGDLNVFVPVRSKDELGNLADNVNRMASQLRKSISEEREAERTKAELITSVSHDLRTPLTSILGYLELVDHDNYQDEVELRHYVAIAHEKAQSLKGLIDDLFEFTQVNSGGYTIRSEDVNLGRLLEQLAEEFVPILEKAGMEYRLNLQEGKIQVRADPSLLVRVFENLMSNAVRYGSEGRFVDIELVQLGTQAVARIANYGSPIPESQLDRIFQRFVRVEDSRSRTTGGAGLGLAIAKSIIELHKGSIRAYNADGRTVFEITLPA